MTDEARRQSAAEALAALREHEDAAALSVAAPVVVATAAHPQVPAQSPGRGGASVVAAGGGVVGALVLIDQILREHGQTLGQLTVTQGPLTGGLVANLWVLLVIVGVWQWAAGRWREHQARQETRWHEHAQREDARAAQQDRLLRAQIKATKAIADEIEHLRRDQREDRERGAKLADEVAALKVDVRDLQRRVPAPGTHEQRAPSN